MKDMNKQKIVRQLLSCLIEKYSGFTVISIEFQKKQKKMLKVIDIIYKPTKRIEIEPFAIFLMIFQKYIHLYIQKEKKERQERINTISVIISTNFLFWKQGVKDMENCSGRPEVLYNFNNQNLISYQDNFHAKGDVSFVIYFDFETTTPTDICLDPEQKKMVFVSYVMVAAFYPELKLDRIIIQRSFSHSIKQLTSLDYFTREQITYIDQSFIKMLKDMAFEVSKRRCKNSIRKMFSIESSLVKKNSFEMV